MKNSLKNLAYLSLLSVLAPCVVQGANQYWNPTGTSSIINSSGDFNLTDLLFSSSTAGTDKAVWTNANVFYLGYGADSGNFKVNVLSTTENPINLGGVYFGTKGTWNLAGDLNFDLRTLGATINFASAEGSTQEISANITSLDPATGQRVVTITGATGKTLILSGDNSNLKGIINPGGNTALEVRSDNALGSSINNDDNRLNLASQGVSVTLNGVNGDLNVNKRMAFWGSGITTTIKNTVGNNTLLGEFFFNSKTGGGAEIKGDNAVFDISSGTSLTYAGRLNIPQNEAKITKTGTGSMFITGINNLYSADTQMNIQEGTLGVLVYKVGSIFYNNASNVVNLGQAGKNTGSATLLFDFNQITGSTVTYLASKVINVNAGSQTKIISFTNLLNPSFFAGKVVLNSDLVLKIEDDVSQIMVLNQDVNPVISGTGNVHYESKAQTSGGHWQINGAGTDRTGTNTYTGDTYLDVGYFNVNATDTMVEGVKTGGGLGFGDIYIAATKGDAHLRFGKTLAATGLTVQNDIIVSANTNGYTKTLTTVGIIDGSLTLNDNLNLRSEGSISKITKEIDVKNNALTITSTSAAANYTFANKVYSSNSSSAGKVIANSSASIIFDGIATYELPEYVIKQGKTQFNISNVFTGNSTKIVVDLMDAQSAVKAFDKTTAKVLNTNNTTQDFGSLILNDHLIIDLGLNSSATISFANSSGNIWDASAILFITNWADSGINFGSQNGLTQAQLEQIQFDGASIKGAYLDEQGYLHAVVPEPASIALLISSFALMFVMYRKQR